MTAPDSDPITAIIIASTIAGVRDTKKVAFPNLHVLTANQTNNPMIAPAMAPVEITLIPAQRRNINVIRREKKIQPLYGYHFYWFFYGFS
jgi:hypothetical protein